MRKAVILTMCVISGSIAGGILWNYRMTASTALPPERRPTATATTSPSIPSSWISKASSPATATAMTIPDEANTSDWMLYHNATFGYSFRYPKDSQLNSESNYFQYFVQANSPTSLPSSSLDVGFEVNFYDEVAISTSSLESSFMQSARRILSGECNSGSPYFRMEIAGESTSTNSNGILDYEAYFEVFDGETDLGIDGPLYAFDIPHSGFDGSDGMLAVIPGDSTFNACRVDPSLRPESPMIRAFIDTISL